MTETETAPHSRWTRRDALGRVRGGIAGLMLSLALAGCEGGAGETEEGAEGDTAGIGGLSPEELQQQAQPMSAEQAAQLGIVDTTEAAPSSPVGPGNAIPGAATATDAPPPP